jgi:hypothetical protein
MSNLGCLTPPEHWTRWISIGIGIGIGFEYDYDTDTDTDTDTERVAGSDGH